MLYLDIQFTLIFVNFALLVLLFFYALYLYRVEKQVKSKYHELTTETEKVIEDANKKAIDILKKSEFISTTLKSEIEANFENIMKHIKEQNMGFYSELKATYKTNTDQIVNSLTKEATEEIEEIGKKSEEVQVILNDKVAEELKETETRLEEEKKQLVSQFELNLKQNINTKFKDVVKASIPEAIQEKIVKEVIIKALKEIKDHG